MTARPPLAAALHAALGRAARADVQALAADIARRHGGTVAAVLFYGSCLRDGDAHGIVDLYVLVDSYRAFHGAGLLAGANRLLPPNVEYHPANAATNAGAKVAVVSRRQFRARLRPGSRDTTLWARFCQPVAMAYCRDEAVRAWVAEALAEAAATAVHWALRLGPEHGTARDYWVALFRHTYGSEMRVEDGARAETVHDFDAGHFGMLLPLAAAPGELEAEDGGHYRRILPAAAIATAQTAWNRRRRMGKALNLARLAKAVFTFDGGVDYIVGKLERHSGQTITLSPWQRRHPLLAAPAIITSLRRKGIIR